MYVYIVYLFVYLDNIKKYIYIYICVRVRVCKFLAQHYEHFMRTPYVYTPFQVTLQQDAAQRETNFIRLYLIDSLLENLIGI